MNTTHSDPTPAPVEWHAPPPVAAEPVFEPVAAPRKNRGKLAAEIAALVIAVGGTTGYLVSHANSSSATTATAQQGAAGGAPAGGPGGGGAGDLGLQPTDYRLDSTITAIGSGTVTIRTTAGATTTYTVTSSTHLVANGSTATELSPFALGDSVRGSTTTQGGTTLNDMVSGALGGGTGGGPGAAQGGTPPQGTTT